MYKTTKTKIFQPVFPMVITKTITHSLLGYIYNISVRGKRIGGGREEVKWELMFDYF